MPNGQECWPNWLRCHCVRCGVPFLPLLYEAYATVALARDPATQALVGTVRWPHGAGRSVPSVPPLSWPSTVRVATVRAGVLPRWAGWLQIASVPVFFLEHSFVSPDAPAPLPGVAPDHPPVLSDLPRLRLGGYALWKDKGLRESPSRDEGTTAPRVTALRRRVGSRAEEYNKVRPRHTV